jgi:hypothetical protein
MTHLTIDDVEELIALVRNNNEFEDNEETVAYWNMVIDKLEAWHSDLMNKVL